MAYHRAVGLEPVAAHPLRAWAAAGGVEYHHAAYLEAVAARPLLASVEVAGEVCRRGAFQVAEEVHRLRAVVEVAGGAFLRAVFPLVPCRVSSWIVWTARLPLPLWLLQLQQARPIAGRPRVIVQLVRRLRA